MLAVVRRFLGTWPARIFFIVLVGSFGLWGVADVVRNLGTSTSVGTVSGRTIEPEAFQQAFTRQLEQVGRMMGVKVDPTPEIRRTVAMQTVQTLLTRTALDAAVANMGLVVPESALVEAVQAIPQFKDKDGKYSPEVARAVLRANSMTEQQLQDAIRSDIGERQLLGTVTSGTTAPDVLVKQVFLFQQEKRTASVVDVPFAGAKPLPAPTEQQLTRWYENNKERYSSQEFRRIKAVVLSPETVASEVQVTDDDVKAGYEQRKAEFNKPEKRSAQVILAPDEAAADRLAEQWRNGADWAAMQAAAAKDGDSAVEVTDSTEVEFPAPELGRAVFAAQAGTVPAPVHSALGWHVLKVTNVTPGTAKSLEQATPELRARVLADKAADLIYDRAGKVGDLLTGGSTLDQLPGDLGLAAVTGTLDSAGDTPEGQPAPIPGSDALRKALIASAFAEKVGDPPKLEQAPAGPDGGQGYYAVSVEEVFEPAPKPLEQVKDAVEADWRRDQVRHAQEEIAAGLLAAVKGGASLETAAGAQGLAARGLPATGRSAPEPGVPPQLLRPLFSLKLHEPTMVETPDGFVVAVVDAITEPDPAKDPIGYGQIRDVMTRALGQDTEAVFTTALREAGRPKVNQTVLNQIALGGQAEPTE